MIKALSVITCDFLGGVFYQDVQDLKYLRRRWKEYEFSVELKAIGLVTLLVGGSALIVYISDICSQPND